MWVQVPHAYTDATQRGINCLVVTFPWTYFLPKLCYLKLNFYAINLLILIDTHQSFSGCTSYIFLRRISPYLLVNRNVKREIKNVPMKGPYGAFGLVTIREVKCPVSVSISQLKAIGFRPLNGTAGCQPHHFILKFALCNFEYFRTRARLWTPFRS